MPVIALALALLWAAPPEEEPVAPGPSAPPGAAALERARLCWAALDVECAEAALVEARAGLAELAPAERVAALVLSAGVALSADRGAAAREHVKGALELEPALAPAWPPAWLEVVAEVRRTLPDRLPPTVRLELPPQIPPKKALTVRVRASDPSGVTRVVVRIGGRELVCATTDGELWVTEVPRELVKLPDLRLEAAATDRAGNQAARADVVPVVPTPVAPEPPITSRWWFWTALGVGVAAIATTVVLVTTGGVGGAASSLDGTILLDVAVDPEPFK